ncbi:MAG: helix-turn-helix transcriptional regulator [Gemmatimonadota bacterium]
MTPSVPPRHRSSPGSTRGDIFLPLVGRTRELAELEAAVEGSTAPDGSDSPRTVLLTGEDGVGKSRLARELASRMQARGWTVAHGRAYPMERGVPYALFSDALLPVLKELPAETISVLSRGGQAELSVLFPALAKHARDVPRPRSGGNPEEFRTRILWNFTEFLQAFAERTPLLLILEDLHWADESSLQLLHFVARRIGDRRVFLLGTYADPASEPAPGLDQVSRSLLSLGSARPVRLSPLDQDQVKELVCRTFGTSERLVGEFSALLYGWTRGSPFFVEEILKSLVAGGKLVYRKGTWSGWDARDFDLPGSVRAAVLARVERLSADARTLLQELAVLGNRAGHSLIAAVSALDQEALLDALAELRRHRFILEVPAKTEVVYEVLQPIVRQTVYENLGMQRARLLHARVAEAVEAFRGEDALLHADELAYHLLRTDAPGLAGKARHYLVHAGREALERHADQEGVKYLEAALERIPAGEDQEREAVLLDLARGKLRLGEHRSAISILEDLLARAGEDPPRRAELHRQLALAHRLHGDLSAALRELDLAAHHAEEGGVNLVPIRMARAQCLQDLGRGTAARDELQACLPLAEAAGDARLLARVHRSLALLHVWIGPPEEARRHARRAIELAREAGDRHTEFWARWGLAIQAGMMGNTEEMREDAARAQELADEIRSPVLRLWTNELFIEVAYATGDWGTGIVLGEQSIAAARALNQRVLLPRLLVWTSLFYVGRGDLERAESLVEEAIRISGIAPADDEAGEDEGEDRDVHLVVPGYIGLAYYLVGIEEYERAIEAARKGLEIAEGTGYILWAIHRLLPILAEACLWAGRIDEAEELGRRMRTHAEAMDHKLGFAWADACDALVCWKRGDSQGGAVLMRRAAERLEEIPMIPYAARIRRQLAGRLAEIGDIEGSLAELRRVHDTFAELGARKELEKARIQFREVGHRPPPRGAGEGLAGLTAREQEIARLVAQRMSNKAIARELGISPRTVSTHLSNIFQKLDVHSRVQLADLLRAQGVLDA